MKRTFVVCDLETTGLDPLSDKIIEVGLVRLEEGLVTQKYHTLVNPEQLLSLKIKRLTGLHDDDLARARTIYQVLPGVLDFIGGSALVGHNIQYDLRFLGVARGLPILNQAYDTLELARLVMPGLASYRLEKLGAALNIKTRATHRALDDALCTGDLLNILLQKLQNMDLTVLTRLSSLLGEARSGWHGFLTGLLKERIKTFPVQKISAAPYWSGGEALEGKSAPVFGDSGAGGERVILTEKEVCFLAGIESPLVGLLPGYEYRPQQEAMMRKVTSSLNEEKFLLMEAGTGVGKSLAYLVPLILWGLANQERVLVATHTINLQEQLWSKDIPLLAGVIDQPFRVALAKGRQNYICLRRWDTVLNSSHPPEEAAFYARILTWLTVTATGDRSELNFIPGDADHWLNLCGEAEGCLGPRCQYNRRCYVNKARKTAEEANLIIANHSLLLSDVRVENRLLPAFGPVVIDEAHHLEDAATAHLGRQFSQGAVYRWLGLAGKYLTRVAENAPPGDGVRWSVVNKETQKAKLETTETLKLFFQQLWDLATDSATGGDSRYPRISLRLPCPHAGYQELAANGARCAGLLRNFVERMKDCAGLMETWAISEEVWAGPVRDLQQLIKSGLDLADDLLFIIEGRAGEFAYWVEMGKSTKDHLRQIALMAAPVNVGSLLYEKFFQTKKSAVLTSATLTVNGTFDYFMERTGLNFVAEERKILASYDSPFEYDRQALLCLSRDLPAQGEVIEEVYLDHLENTIYKLVQITGGRTLVLFTSHRILREIYRRLKPRLEEADIFLLGHGLDGSRARILEEFKTTKRTVLFGSSSFWEGVDVPGEALSCVIMVKLPFMSPSVPVIEARLEDLARRERNGFRVFSVPQAVIRFKQGFGRLIRNSNDRGCVVVLDSRLLSKNYGRYFLRSLPVRSHFRGGTDLIFKKIADWLETSPVVNTWQHIK
jgi:ATP-dependent DNA helicase DinG